MKCFWDETTNEGVKDKRIRLKIEDKEGKGESIEEMEIYFRLLNKLKVRRRYNINGRNVYIRIKKDKK